jgi:hypothetical protein
MSLKSIAALGLVLTLGFGAAAQADVVQTTVGIQQSNQSQYSDGPGSVQNAVNLQNLDQRSAVRGARRGENVQQTTAGVQNNDQVQESYGRRGRQNSVNVNDLLQNSSVDYGYGR